jgi:hypothetical protein
LVNFNHKLINMKPYYAITALYPPTVLDTISGRYAVSGSTWIPVTKDVTQKMAQDAWTPLLYREVKPATVNTYKILSASSGKTYNVTQDKGHWSCSCPAYGFRNKCKHIEEAKNQKPNS